MSVFILVYLLFIQPLNTLSLSPKNDLSNPAEIIFQSSDAGKTWQNISIGLPNKLGVNSIYTDDGIVYLSTEQGVFQNSTSSNSPEWVKDIFLVDKISRIFPGQLGTYAQCYDNNRIYQKIPGSGMWIQKFKGLSDQILFTVLDTKGSVLVGGVKGIFKSFDDGNTWKHVFKDDFITSFTESNGVIIAGGEKGLIKSMDGGDHWVRIHFDDRAIRKTKYIKNRFIALSEYNGSWKDSKSFPDVIANRLHTSSDNGSTWERIDQNIMPIKYIQRTDNNIPPVRIIKDIVNLGDMIFISLDSGIYRSFNWGRTWSFYFLHKRISHSN